MPTGYTAGVADGEITSLREYAWRCARGMGAMIVMRDSAPDAPIPERFEPSAYHAEGIEKAKAALVEAEGWDGKAARRRAESSYEEAVEAYRKEAASRADQRKRYEVMLAEVRASRPTSGEPAGLWDFMESQLVESIEFDCGGFEHWPRPERLDGPAFKAKVIERAKKDIAYHQQQYADDVERTNGRNAWMAALVDAVGEPTR